MDIQNMNADELLNEYTAQIQTNGSDSLSLLAEIKSRLNKGTETQNIYNSLLKQVELFCEILKTEKHPNNLANN